MGSYDEGVSGNYRKQARVIYSRKALSYSYYAWPSADYEVLNQITVAGAPDLLGESGQLLALEGPVALARGLNAYMIRRTFCAHEGRAI